MSLHHHCEERDLEPWCLEGAPRGQSDKWVGMMGLVGQPPSLVLAMFLGDGGVTNTRLPESCCTQSICQKKPLSATSTVAWGNAIFSFSNSFTTFFPLHISIKCCLLNISLVLIWTEGFCYHWPLGDQFSCTEPVLVFNAFFSKSCISTSVEPFVCWHLPHFQLNECLKKIFLPPVSILTHTYASAI